MKAKKGYFPESYSLRLPAGYLAKIDRAAEEAGMSRPEWLRHLLRRALGAAQRKRQRDGGRRI